MRGDSRTGYFVPACASGIGLSPGARVVGKPPPSVQVPYMHRVHRVPWSQGMEVSDFQWRELIFDDFGMFFQEKTRNSLWNFRQDSSELIFKRAYGA